MWAFDDVLGTIYAHILENSKENSQTFKRHCRYWSEIIGLTAAILSESEKLPVPNEQFNMSTAAKAFKNTL